MNEIEVSNNPIVQIKIRVIENRNRQLLPVRIYAGSELSELRRGLGASTSSGIADLQVMG